MWRFSFIIQRVLKYMNERDEMVGKEFDNWVVTGRDVSMEQGHCEATMKLFSMIDSLITNTEEQDLSSHISVQSSFDQKVLLDIGCGNGWALRKFIDIGGHQGYGCDLSSKMIEKAQQFQNYNIEYYTGDIAIFYENLQQKQMKKPNICICIESLYYHENPKTSVSSMYEILEKDGCIGIMVDLYEESWGTHAWIDALHVDVHLLSIEAYKKLLRDVGFVNVQHLQFQMTSPITTKDNFVCNSYWPTYEHYKLYRQKGSLLVIGQKI